MYLPPRLILAAVVLSTLAAAQQEKRIVPLPVKGRKVAFVVGNQNYKLWPLTNPLSDADDMKKGLEAVGFQVDILKNATRAQFETELDSFVESLEAGDIVFFYYSGHGIAIQNQNYLVPIDFSGTNEASVRHNATSADQVQEAIEARKPQLAMLVLDACRDNPFVRSKGLDNGGLVPMREAKGTLIAFAAGPGEAAIDTRDERNSLYTKYLLAALQVPGLSVRDLFDQVAEQVHEASGEKILPSVNRTLIGDFVFRPVDAKAGEAKSRFAVIRDANDPALFEAFIREFPNQPETADAETRLKQLQGDLAAREQQLDKARLAKEDDDLWNAVKESKLPAIVELYTKKYPSGLHAFEAVKLRDQLVTRENEAQRQYNAQGFQAKDDAAWDFARNSNSTLVLDQYLKDFPAGTHSTEVRKLRDEVAARDAAAEELRLAQVRQTGDDSAWEMARNSNSKAALDAYLGRYPTGSHVTEARDLRAKIPAPGPTTPTSSGSAHLPYRNPRDKSEYIWIPGGEFVAGCRASDSECGPDEPRSHAATIPDAGFWMGQTEVTVLSYKLFADAEKRKMPSASDDNRHWTFTDHPMIKVSWQDAKAYCEWTGGRLPSGDEWERAARGGGESRYPWGDEIQPNQAKYIKTTDKTGAVTAPVKSFEPNGYGLYDVAGNVWEWTVDAGPSGLHLARGGSWDSSAKSLRVTSVRTFKGDEGANVVGFRCLLPPLRQTADH